MSIRRILNGAALGALAAVAACTQVQTQPFPEPIRAPKALPELPADAAEGNADAALPSVSITRSPGFPTRAAVVAGVEDPLGKDLQGDPVGPIKFADAPLAAFINEVFGELLGMSFHVAPTLRGKTDLVTLGVAEPVPPSQLFATARQVLRHYGVDIVKEDGLLAFVASEQITSQGIPLLISGRARPEVPPTHRVVFQLVPLRTVRTARLQNLISGIFKQQLEVVPDGLRNAMLLKGNIEMVGRAVAMIEALDRPSLEGQRSVLIEPVFMSVQDMSRALNSILLGEGYATQTNTGNTGAAVVLLPLPSINKLVVFARDDATIEHIEEWARVLDQRRQGTIEDAWFTYHVQHTQAAELTATLNAMLGDSDENGTENAQSEQPAAEGGARAQAGERRQASARAGRFVVDENRNMLLFRGAGKEWADILAVLAELDKPVASVMIDLLVAEVTLTDDRGSGVEFLFKSGVGDDRQVSGGTLKRLGPASKALSLTLDSGGLTRGMLNFFYDDSRVAIRSNVRLVVKSGGSGKFDVGNEIPTVVQNTTAGGLLVDGTTPITQQVQYRKTGVLLTIEPIVQANGLVDVTINQQLSEARPTANTSLTGSPTILNRSISTSLTLRDGGSLVMGGLTSLNQSAGGKGLPGIARVPLLGRLFRSDTYQEDRTELVVMVIPYVISSHEEGRALTERIQQELELHHRFMERGARGAEKREKPL